jgi:hypothetical protein
LLYRPARLHSPGGIGSLGLIFWLLKSLKIRALTKYSAIPSWSSDLDGESLGLLAATAPGRHLTDLTLTGNAATLLASGGEVTCCCQLLARFSGQINDKKENKIFLILQYKEIQMGSGAKSYMRKGLLIYEEFTNLSPYMRRPLVIYDLGTRSL